MDGCLICGGDAHTSSPQGFCDTCYAHLFRANFCWADRNALVQCHFGAS